MRDWKRPSGLLRVARFKLEQGYGDEARWRGTPWLMRHTGELIITDEVAPQSGRGPRRDNGGRRNLTLLHSGAWSPMGRLSSVLLLTGMLPVIGLPFLPASPREQIPPYTRFLCSQHRRDACSAKTAAFRPPRSDCRVQTTAIRFAEPLTGHGSCRRAGISLRAQK